MRYDQPEIDKIRQVTDHVSVFYFNSIIDLLTVSIRKCPFNTRYQYVTRPIEGVNTNMPMDLSWIFLCLKNRAVSCMMRALVTTNYREQECSRRVSCFRNSVSQNHLAGGKNEKA